MTIEYARSREMEVKGVILNWFHKGNAMEEDNLRFIEEYTGVPVIACAEENARDLEIEPERLAALYR